MFFSVKIKNEFDNIPTYLVTFYHHLHEITKITNSIQSNKSYRKYMYKSENGRTRTAEYIRGGIRCHGGVSIPSRSITPAVSPFSRIGKQYEQ
jgi:hypothetical protein